MPLVVAMLALVLVIVPASGGSRGPKAPHRFFGINLGAIPSASDANRMARGGARFARLPFDWRALQPQQGGAYNWTGTDALVSNLAGAGMGTIPVLYGSPAWLKDNYRKPPLRPAAARRGWRGLITAAVNRYGPAGDFWISHPTLPYLPLRYWQVWNEPNLPGFFAPKASPKRYARLLHISAVALRKANPSVKVVLAGLPHTPGRAGQMFSWVFLRKLYKAGAKGDFDVVAVHPFAFGVPGMADQLRKMRAVTRHHGQGHIPMWIDELGWSSGHQKWNPFAVGRKRQARYLRQSFKYVLAHRKSLGITRLEWVAWRDSPPAKGCVFCSAGLTNEHGQAKPAWRAYKHLAKR